MKTWILVFLLMGTPIFGQELDSSEAEDKAIDDRMQNNIDVYINLNTFDKYSDYWKKQYNRYWVSPWTETITKTVAYQENQRVIELAQKTDDRIKELKKYVRVFLSQTNELPPLSYCVVPYGFKVTALSEWIQFPRDSIPYPNFFLEFFNYLHEDFTLDKRTREYIARMKSRDHEFYYQQQYEQNQYAIKWLNKHNIPYTSLTAGLYYGRFNYSILNKEGNRDYFYKDISVLEEVGYTPKPAIAWDRPPSVPENPMDYLLLKNPKP